MLKFGNATYLVAKGSCYTCARGDSLISTEIIVEGEGILCLCPGCIHDLALAAGYQLNATEEFDRLASVFATEQQENGLLRAEIDRLQDRLDRLGDEWVSAVERAALQPTTVA